MLQDTEDKAGVLGGEDQEESGKGCRRAEAAGGDGMALYHGMGV